jgi:hypothetical protein
VIPSDGGSTGGGSLTPSIMLSASPTFITAGNSATLTWSSTNASSCVASGGWSGSKAISGSQAVTPAVSTTYTLTCSGSSSTAQSAVTISVTSQPQAQGGYDIIIIAGQSNAVGAGLGSFSDSAANTATDAKIFQLGRYGAGSLKVMPATWVQNGITYDALQHWNITANRASMGLAVPFARRYAQEQLAPGRSILIVPAAYGGTSILKWLGDITAPTTTPNALYDDMKNRVNTALALPGGTNKIVAFLWHQGESDVSSAAGTPGIMTPAIYQQKLTLILQKLRTDFPSQPAYPVVGGLFVPEWPSAWPGASLLLPAKIQIESVIKQVFAADVRGGVADTAGLTANYPSLTSDINQQVHFSAASQVTLGARYYQKWKDLVATPPAAALGCTLQGLNAAPANATVVLSWTTTGTPGSGNIKQNGSAVIAAPALPTGSEAITLPSTAGNYSYVMTVVRGAATASCTKTIAVTAPAAANGYHIGAYYFGYFQSDPPIHAAPTYLAQGATTYGPLYPNNFVFNQWMGIRELAEQNYPIGFPAAWKATGPAPSQNPLYRVPILGYYDQVDPSVVESQVAMAQAYGLQYFNFYWYWDHVDNVTPARPGPTLSKALENFAASAKIQASGFKFMLSMCQGWNGGFFSQSDFQATTDQLSDYISRSNYLTLPDGRPIFEVCGYEGIGLSQPDRQAIGAGGAGPADWQDRIQTFFTLLRQKVQEKTGKALYIELMYEGKGRSSLSSGLLSTWDATSCILNGVVPVNDYVTYSQTLTSGYTTFASYLPGKPTTPCVASNFDPRPRWGFILPTTATFTVAQGQSVSAFGQALAKTKQWMDTKSDPASKYLNIYAWNEFHEGGIIEPTEKDGAAYLSAVNTTFGLPTPPANHAPNGSLDMVAASNWNASGWAYDADGPTQAVTVNFYAKKDSADPGKLIGSTLANYGNI